MTPENYHYSSGSKEVIIKIFNKNLSALEIEKTIIIFEKHFADFKEEVKQLLQDEPEHKEVGLVFEKEGVD